MTDSIVNDQRWQPIEDQPDHTLDLTRHERDSLIVSAIQVDSTWIITSRYSDDLWHISGFTTNVSIDRRRLFFEKVPAPFRDVMKSIIYRYIRRGLSTYSSKRPRGHGTKIVFSSALQFLLFAEKVGVDTLSEISPAICASYIKYCRDIRRIHNGKPLGPRALQARLRAIENLYHLSQYTEGPMLSHPWPGTTSAELSGVISDSESKTPLIPDDVFCSLFANAYKEVECADYLLDISDSLHYFSCQNKNPNENNITRSKNKILAHKGWNKGLQEFSHALTRLRTACYIVLASTSGCRNHELAYLQTGAHHKTVDDNGVVYHWMRSRSEKTDIGIHDWMIPEASVRALRVMERLAAPFQARIATEIEQRRRANPQDPEIAEAVKHRKALFLGLRAIANQKKIRTLSGKTWGVRLKEFSAYCGLSWDLSSHQFRRKFANYAAHSRFGDLRYLKEHYAHWSMDMTLSYALDNTWGKHLDSDLLSETAKELQVIKTEVVDKWLSDSPLAGGYGLSIKKWQREPQNLLIFKDRATMLKSIAESTIIRSNGHAWCTADHDDCVGNTLDRSRCGSCSNSVIGTEHAALYKRTYEETKILLDCPDIGDGGRQRVEKIMIRCREVLFQLGIDPEC
ncbi:integrase [Pseudomonas putida]|uniref:integrase n=1 Tax=Pseudomonas putida TaxID=303 RepID=UPI0021675D8B|nr:integrase [Pseudomonas putida]MCS4065479.1 hypothetical protein [Pseudomonas putida]